MQKKGWGRKNNVLFNLRWIYEAVSIGFKIQFILFETA